MKILSIQETEQIKALGILLGNSLNLRKLYETFCPELIGINSIMGGALMNKIEFIESGDNTLINIELQNLLKELELVISQSNYLHLIKKKNEEVKNKI